MKRFFCLLFPVFCLLAGCASTDYKSYLSAQQAAIRDAQIAQKPLFELEAEPGQSITGLRAVRVYMPVQAPAIQQARTSEWAGVIGQGLTIGGTVLGIKYAGDAATNLAGAVGSAANHGYQYIQAPQANQTIGSGFIGSGLYSGENGGVLGSGSQVDTTHTPTIVEQPPPLVVDPVVVTQPPPIVITP
jgi:hypothetical protein